MNFKNKFITKLLNKIYLQIKNRLFLRRSVLILIDSFLILLSINLTTIIINYEENFISINNFKEIRILIIIFGIFIYLISGQYKGLSRYIGSSSFYELSARNLSLVIFAFFYGLIFEGNNPSLIYLFILFLILTFFTGSSRILIKDAFQKFKILKGKSKKVAIYGAGSAGAQLEASLRLSMVYKISFFIDDDRSLSGRSLNGIKIINPIEIKKYKHKIDQVFLAIPSLNREERRVLLKGLQIYNIPILQIPSIDEITTGKARINSLKPVLIEDLLGRDSVPPKNDILGKEVNNSIICVTGAGGSIGSELCRQIYKLNPKKLILFEISEPSLYKISKELTSLDNNAIELKPILGNCLDSNLISKIFKREKVDLIFHAAAYKHVPIVEKNPIIGIQNNVFSTLNIAIEAQKADVKKMILISSDKAVRPTNVMGASKRLSELIIQAFANDKDSKSNTSFSMVRFGNVLGSSGSVVPLFRKQIILGGPLTVTDKEVTRFFMTIQEASNLVLQAASLAKGGEVFILQMGNPIKILELAKQMITLSGLTLKNESNPNGDIEIVFTGLRQGEKLYEELLIDAKSIPTIHPLIFMANEKYIVKKELIPILESLRIDLQEYNIKKVFNIMNKVIPEWEISNKKSCNNLI